MTQGGGNHLLLENGMKTANATEDQSLDGALSSPMISSAGEISLRMVTSSSLLILMVKILFRIYFAYKYF